MEEAAKEPIPIPAAGQEMLLILDFRVGEGGSGGSKLRRWSPLNFCLREQTIYLFVSGVDKLLFVGRAGLTVNRMVKWHRRRCQGPGVCCPRNEFKSALFGRKKLSEMYAKQHIIVDHLCWKKSANFLRN
jgi:hypothetical protein